MTHQQIADLHKQYGVFLCPSRMDTQGVSRDEAMSSGLVPITNKVGAIPEFLDEFKFLLSEPEDYKGLADKLKELYYNPDLYCELSKKMSDSVNSRSSEIIVSQEVCLIV